MRTQTHQKQEQGMTPDEFLTSSFLSTETK